jgi:hypothetical protein
MARSNRARLDVIVMTPKLTLLNQRNAESRRRAWEQVYITRSRADPYYLYIHNLAGPIMLPRGLIAHIGMIADINLHINQALALLVPSSR